VKVGTTLRCVENSIKIAVILLFEWVVLRNAKTPNTASCKITRITLPLRYAHLHFLAPYARTGVRQVQVSGTTLALPARASVVALPLRGVRLLSSLRGSRLVPAKRRYLVPGEHRDGAQSHPPVPLRGITHTVSPLSILQ
jgi:hypothetical protein